MKRNAVSGIMLTLLLVSMSTLAFSTGDTERYRWIADLNHHGFDVNGLVERNLSFERAREWGDFAYVDEDSAELVIGVSDARSDVCVEFSRIIDMNGGQIVNTVSIGEVLWAVVADIPFDLIPSFVNKIKATGLAKYIEPNIRFQTQFVPNDPYWSWQWGPQKIEADWAWNTTTGDPSIIVGVVDTGIDWNHPNLAANYIALGYDWVNRDSDPMDDHGHGTHVAGTIAAELNNGVGIAGMAQVKIMAEKGLDSGGVGYLVDLANAIIHAVDQGADILSNSWASYQHSALIYDAFKYAYDAGVLIVAAAGNDGRRIKTYPAAYDEVIAVTATDQRDNSASFTNFGYWVEMAAPGVDILSTVWDDTYTYKSGTSMSTPHVSGVAALIWSRFPYMTRDQVRAQLRYTADDLGDPGFDDYYGYGRINARKAVERVPPDHDLLVFEWERPPYVKLGEPATFNTAVLNFGTNDETNVQVQLLGNDNLIKSVSIDFLPWGASTTVGISWTPTVEGRYNVTSYVVPVPGEMITQNNLITEFVTVVALPPETNWTSLATDLDEGLGTNLQMISGQLYSDIIFFKVEHHRAWTTINDIDTGIFIDADQDPGTGLPDGTYPGQNTGIGANYLIVVGWEATEMWRWDPIAGLWDSDNPISLTYLDAPDGSNVFVVGVFLADVETTGALDCAVTDTESGWDWMPDIGHFTLPFWLWDNLAVSLEAATFLWPGDSTSLDATVYNLSPIDETNVELRLLINGTLVDSVVILELLSGSSYTLSYLWTPTIEGVYNLTVYAPPVPLEEFITNNIATKMVHVRSVISYVAFEEAHLPSFTIGNNPAYSATGGYSEFANYLTANDYFVSTIDPGTTIDLNVLDPVDILVIVAPQISYSTPEIDAIETWIKGGGRLLLITDWDGYGTQVNAIAARFSITQPFGLILDSDENIAGNSRWPYYDGANLLAHPVTGGVTRVEMYASDGITNAPADEIPLIVTDSDGTAIWFTGQPALGVSVMSTVDGGTAGFGRLIIITDSNIWDSAHDADNDGDTNFYDSDNEILALKSINWLAVKYKHELAVSLDAPYFLPLGDSLLLNATVHNTGLNNEPDVELQLLVNGTLVNSTTIPELLVGNSITISYLWTPTVEEAAYNVTAYAPPVYEEYATVNNVKSTVIEIRYLPDIIIVADDDGSSWICGTSLLEFELALATAGYDYYVWNESTMGHPSLEFLLNFKLVIWTTGDFWGSTVDSIDADTLEAYFALGGNILLEGEDIGFDHVAVRFMANVAHAIYQVDDTGAPGLTVTDPTHPVTRGLPSSFTWLTDPPYDDGVTPTNGGFEVIRYADRPWTAVTLFNGTGTSNGSVVYYAFPIHSLAQPERDCLIINSVSWLIPHDVTVANVTPFKTAVGQGYAMFINVTAENHGDFTETFDVTVYANETSIALQTVTLTSGSSTTITFTWDTTGVALGNYTITAHALPIPHETDTADNTYTVDGAVFVVTPGDVNADGIVSILDLAGISAHWYPGPPIGPLGYDPNFDINGDGAVNMVEINILSAYWTGPPKGPLAL